MPIAEVFESHEDTATKVGTVKTVETIQNGDAGTIVVAEDGTRYASRKEGGVVAVLGDS